MAIYGPSTDVVAIEAIPVAFPLVQPLPAEHVLVVGSRCMWRPAGPPPNAYVFNANGDLVNESVIGDGVAHVQTDSAGNSWVGYHDEGVFGNFGWGRSGPEPIGACGLIRWSGDLTAEWRHTQDSEFGSIDDCYALNVRGDTAWAYYYSEFPIIAVDTVVHRGWLTDTAGARAIVTDGERIALVGGYQPERNRVVVGHLVDGILEHERRARLLLENGRALDDAIVIGRGEELHVFSGDDWYKASIDDPVE